MLKKLVLGTLLMSAMSISYACSVSANAVVTDLRSEIAEQFKSGEQYAVSTRPSSYPTSKSDRADLETLRADVAEINGELNKYLLNSFSSNHASLDYESTVSEVIKQVVKVISKVSVGNSEYANGLIDLYAPVVINTAQQIYNGVPPTRIFEQVVAQTAIPFITKTAAEYVAIKLANKAFYKALDSVSYGLASKVKGFLEKSGIQDKFDPRQQNVALEGTLCFAAQTRKEVAKQFVDVLEVMNEGGKEILKSLETISSYTTIDTSELSDLFLKQSPWLISRIEQTFQKEFAVYQQLNANLGAKLERKPLPYPETYEERLIWTGVIRKCRLESITSAAQECRRTLVHTTLIKRIAETFESVRDQARLMQDFIIDTISHETERFDRDKVQVKDSPYLLVKPYLDHVQDEHLRFQKGGLGYRNAVLFHTYFIALDQAVDRYALKVVNEFEQHLNVRYEARRNDAKFVEKGQPAYSEGWSPTVNNHGLPAIDITLRKAYAKLILKKVHNVDKPSKELVYQRAWDYFQ